MICLLAAAGLAATLSADAWNKKTELTVNERIQIPGATLTPGKYVVKLVDSQANRNIVQFTNEREDRVISTVVAIPNQRLQPTGKTEFDFYETAVGGAPALRAWFYAGDNFGQEFAYPEQSALELARATGQDVPSLSAGDLKSAPVTNASPKQQETNEASAAKPTPPPTPAPTPAQPRTRPAVQNDEPAKNPEPTTLAQAQPRPQQPQEATPAPQRQPAPEPAQSELPATASPAPALGLLGLLLLGGGIGLRRLSKHESR
jgi:hypothetical protein